ncbi:hypothetical protein GCM10011369_28360 [Neiella marina]|uniref:Uncharacterized protein n=1 Tax=Neiella marina TaxID=508461 RepID=A0A8J2U7N0_9GAMM|nr:enoyl-CoA hydratase/isomerase family protein [Neiella marina]GGA84660.1 hypothetical protein GCM10011369_28360 [Neiella marina]
MAYQNFTTFKVEIDAGIAWVTFDYPPVNVQGQEMLADLNSLAFRLERDRSIKVVVFQSAHPEIWVCHYDTDLLKEMSRDAISRDEAKVLDLQAVCERVSKLPQATIAKLEGFARRIAQWPADSINACKQAVYESIDLLIEQALKAEAYWLYQATSKTSAVTRFQWANDQGAQFDIDNQRNWEQLVVNVQDVND